MDNRSSAKPASIRYRMTWVLRRPNLAAGSAIPAFRPPVLQKESRTVTGS
ncbi:hypothetical protein [Sphingobacterium siyangense]